MKKELFMSLPYKIFSNQVRENNYHHLESTVKTTEFESVIGQQSQRQFAQEHKIPRTTLQYWLSRK